MQFKLMPKGHLEQENLGIHYILGLCLKWKLLK